MHKIGFMQGRLCSKVNGKIQAFPWQNWKNEFPEAQKLSLPLMEWTLDQENLYDNPIMNANGQAEIKALCLNHNISVLSLTGDCFMQAPFYKKTGEEQQQLKKNFKDIVSACSEVGVKMVVVPLVDAGRLDDRDQEKVLVDFLLSETPFFRKKNVKIIFEIDFEPSEQKRFIDQLPTDSFGINYDSGNSAALGFNPANEIPIIGARILNVHIKDRKFKGTTVPLSMGDCDFQSVFQELKKINYQGQFILQTARAEDENHAGVLSTYIQFTQNLIRQHLV